MKIKPEAESLIGSSVSEMRHNSLLFFFFPAEKALLLHLPILLIISIVLVSSRCGFMLLYVNLEGLTSAERCRSR